MEYSYHLRQQIRSSDSGQDSRLIKLCAAVFFGVIEALLCGDWKVTNVGAHPLEARVSWTEH